MSAMWNCVALCVVLTRELPLFIDEKKNEVQAGLEQQKQLFANAPLYRLLVSRLQSASTTL
jgi:hypothetical protein